MKIKFALDSNTLKLSSFKRIVVSSLVFIILFVVSLKYSSSLIASFAPVSANLSIVYELKLFFTLLSPSIRSLFPIANPTLKPARDLDLENV